MKKLFALMMALMLALSCAFACADTIYTQVTIDTEQATQLLSGFGMPEEQMGLVTPVIALVNALGVNVTTAADGAQVDLDLNGEPALSLGWATDEAGASIVSSVFPNYILTIQNETIEGMMQQMGGGEGGEGGLGGFDFAAMGEVFGGYYSKWFTSCAAAAQPGEPVSGEYEFYGVAFDTMVPITVDVPTLKAATETLMDDILSDPTAMGMIQGMAQSIAQSSGQEFDATGFEDQFKAGFEEWIAHFPETVTAEFYANSDGSEGFYLKGGSVMEGSDEAAVTYDMLYQDEQHMIMNCSTGGEGAMDMSFKLEGTDMRMDFSMQGMYFGLGMSFPEGEFDLDVYFMNPDAPLVCVKVTMAEGGERTLPVDGAGKTTLALEEVMANGNSEAAQGLYADIQANGLGALLGAVMQAVPELGSLMGMAG